MLISRFQEAGKTSSAQAETFCQPASQELEGFRSSVFDSRSYSGAWKRFGDPTGVMG